MDETKLKAPQEAGVETQLRNTGCQSSWGSAMINNDSIEQIRELFDHKAVLLPVYKNTKKPVFSKWQQLTFEQTSRPDCKVTSQKGGQKCEVSYHEELKRAELTRLNIGVSLGKASGGLCTIDADSDEGLAALLQCNPGLQGSLITRRKRGGNVWVFIEGDYPTGPNGTFIKTKADKAWGEFRADGKQTVIRGLACDPKKPDDQIPLPYRFINRAKPKRMRFADIVWPANVIPPGSKGHLELKVDGGLIEEGTRTSSPINSSEYLYTCNTVASVAPIVHQSPEQVLQVAAQRKAAEAAFLKKYPRLGHLYEDYIKPRLAGMAGARNAFIVQGVPFLFHVVALRVAIDIMDLFYYSNPGLFKDSLEQHQKEAMAMLANVEQRYIEELPAGERALYQSLNKDEQATFRICRDLATRSLREGKGPILFMGRDQLASRLGVNTRKASNAITSLCGLEIMEEMERGMQYAPGKPPQATTYRWRLLLVIPAAQPMPTANQEAA